jgi:hypothetical protein
MNLLKWTVSGVIAVSPLCLTGCHEHRQAVVVREQPVVVEQPAPVVIVAEPPPPIIVEKVPHGPHGQVWIVGHYEYVENHYVWRHGRYAPPPHKGAKWEADRWEHTDHGYEYHSGHWK